MNEQRTPEEDQEMRNRHAQRIGKLHKPNPWEEFWKSVPREFKLALVWLSLILFSLTALGII